MINLNWVKRQLHLLRQDGLKFRIKVGIKKILRKLIRSAMTHAKIKFLGKKLGIKIGIADQLKLFILRITGPDEVSGLSGLGESGSEDDHSLPLGMHAEMICKRLRFSVETKKHS